MKRNTPLRTLLAAVIALLAVSTTRADEPAYKCIDIAAGNQHALYLYDDGTLWAGGMNTYGQLGVGDTIQRSGTVQILDNVRQVAAGHSHTVALRNDGSVWTWGANKYGRLGDGTNTDRLRPVKVMEGVRYIAAGWFQTAAITYDGTLYMWGYNDYNLGDGTGTYRDRPVKIMDDVRQVVTGYNHTAAIDGNGNLWLWGRRVFRGDGKAEKDLPKPTMVMSGVRDVAIGYNCTFIIKNDGSIHSWGFNDATFGLLGDGTLKHCRRKPVKIMNNVRQISADLWHAAAVTNDGALFTWGDNIGGRLGLGTADDNPHPTPTRVLSNVKKVTCGGLFTLVLMNDGTTKMAGTILEE